MFNLKLQLTRIKTLHAYRSGDWRKVPIIESKQPLILIPSEFSRSYYFHTMSLTTEQNLWLREEVFDRFLQAGKNLERRGFELKVYDGWRPLKLQQNLFWHYMRLFTVEKFGEKEKFDHLNGPKEIETYFHTLPKELQTVLFEANRTYVSWPSREPTSPSPHATGGAIDVWPFKEGRPVNLGVPFDWMESNAGAFYHLKIKRERFVGNDLRICRNRKQLLLAMFDAGFTAYGPEVWHFNFGNQMDALVKKSHAIYSYCEP